MRATISKTVTVDVMSMKKAPRVTGSAAPLMKGRTTEQLTADGTAQTYQQESIEAVKGWKRLESLIVNFAISSLVVAKQRLSFDVFVGKCVTTKVNETTDQSFAALTLGR